MVVDHAELTDVGPNVGVMLPSLRGIWTEGLTPTKSHCLHGLSYHPHFLKIDQIVDKCFVALMSECHVFNHQRHEGNDGRIQLGDCESIRSVVPGRIHQVFKFSVKLLKLAGKLLPGLTESAHCWVTQSHNDGKEAI